MTLSPSDYLTLLEADIARMRAIDASYDHAPVAACPGWDLDGLLGHSAGVMTYATINLDAGPDGTLTERPELDESKSGRELFAHAATELVRAFGETDPDEFRPTWAGAPTSAWYWRRMAQEFAVHRWDAQQAAATAGGPAPEPIAAALAVDGVNEFCEVFLVPFAKHRGIVGTGETVHLHATDVEEWGIEGGEWMFTFTPDGVEVTFEHGKGDMAARATASDLLLFVWNRRPVDLTSFGDTDVAEFWSSRVVI